MKRVLVLEDDPNLVMSLNIRLRGAGYDVEAATDAVEAVEAAGRYRPHLMIVDVAVPRGDGLHAAERVKGIPGLEDVPIVFLTASQEPGLQARARELGAAAFLSKPYDSAHLLDVIREALSPAGDARRRS